MEKSNQVVTGLSLYMSNHMETLGDICALVMSEYPLPDPFAHETVVVMNSGMSNFLSQRIASMNNIAALIDYPQVWQLIFNTHRLLNPDAPKQDLFDREHITWNIFSQIKSWSQQRSKLYERLEQYLADDTYGDKAYELSAKIADTLDQYQMYRPQWILKWNKLTLQDFANYEANPDDSSNPINIFIDHECKEFTRRKSGFKKAAIHKSSAAVDNLDKEVSVIGERVSSERVKLIKELFKNNVWQIKLWCLLRYNLNLLSSDDLSINDVTSERFLWLLRHLDRSQVMNSLIYRLRNERNLPKLYDRVFVFGVSALPRIVVEFLDALALHCSVNVMLLNPCSEYWADIAPRHRQDFDEYVKLIQASTKSIHEKTTSYKKKILTVNAQNMSLNDYDDAGERIDGNPLLLSYGQQGRDNLYMFFDRDVVPDNISCFVEPECDVPLVSEQVVQQGKSFEKVTGGNVLTFLQRQLLNLNQGSSRYIIRPDDTSFSVHSCHTKRREIEILHDALLERFNRSMGPQGKKIFPRDIVVMVPTINEYAPHISAVFGGYKEDSDNYIPFVIADRTESEANPVCQALLKLLEIGSIRVTASFVIELLSEEAIASRFNLNKDDVDVIATWLQENNIYWGLDDKDVLDIAQINIPGTFEQGMDRMVLGAMLGPNSTMPCFSEIEGFDAVILGKFHDFLSALRDLRAEFTPELSLCPADWSERLNHKLTERFFDSSFETEQALDAVYQGIEKLKTVFAHLEHQPSINLPVFAATLRQALTAERKFQPFLKNKVNFCSLVPMRAVPFEHVFILGLNDSDFPREERSPGFNLMSCRDLFERGDRSRGIDDRYLFLEAILSARSSLYLSFIGQSPVDKTPLNPSILLDELLYYLCDNCALQGHEGLTDSQRQQQVYERLVRKEYLNGYNLNNYLLQDNELSMPAIPSFNKSYVLLDNSIKRSAPILAEGIFNSDLSSLNHQVLSLWSLFSFIKKPSRAFLRNNLKIDLGYIEQDALQEDEFFVLQDFEANSYVNSLLQLDVQERTLYLERLSLLGKLPYGIFKTNLLTKIKHKTQSFSDCLAKNFNITNYGQLALLSCDSRVFELIVPKTFFSADVDILALAQANAQKSIKYDEDHYRFEITLQANAHTKPVLINVFSNFKRKSNRQGSNVYTKSGDLVDVALQEMHFANCSFVFDLLEEAIGQYLYDGGLKDVYLVHMGSKLNEESAKVAYLKAFSHENMLTIIYALLLCYVLSKVSAMPIMKGAISSLVFNEQGQLRVRNSSDAEAAFRYDSDSEFLFGSLDAILENKRLSAIAGSFLDFYIKLLAPQLDEVDY